MACFALREQCAVVAVAGVIKHIALEGHDERCKRDAICVPVRDVPDRVVVSVVEVLRCAGEVLCGFGSQLSVTALPGKNVGNSNHKSIYLVYHPVFVDMD